MTRLGDVCQKATSNIAQKDLENRNGEYEIYGASGFIKKVDFYQQENPYIAVVKDGAGIGRVMKLPAKTSVIGTMQYIIPNNDIDISYLAYAMENMNLAKYYTGATIPHIYFKDYQKEELPVPSLEEQRKIAAVLDKVSDLIAKRRQQLDKLDLLVEARFTEMFKQIQEMSRLEEYTILITKGASPKWQGIDYAEYGTLFITSENVRKGYLDLSRRKYLDSQINEIQPRSILKKDDILINIVGASIGRAAVYDLDDLANINQAVALVRLRKNMLNQKFLLTFLNSAKALELYDSMKKGGARDNLSLKNIADLPIPKAPLDLQNQFSVFVEQTEQTKISIKESLTKLETLKKALMQEYFG